MPYFRDMADVSVASQRLDPRLHHHSGNFLGLTVCCAQTRSRLCSNAHTRFLRSFYSSLLPPTNRRIREPMPPSRREPLAQQRPGPAGKPRISMFARFRCLLHYLPSEWRRPGDVASPWIRYGHGRKRGGVTAIPQCSGLEAMNNADGLSASRDVLLRCSK